MGNLMAVYIYARGKGFVELKTTEAFVSIALSPGYKLIDWIYDDSVDRDTRLLFKTKVSKSPFIESLLTQKEDEQNQLFEFKYKNLNAAGLGAAYLFDSLAVSFDNAGEWDNHLIELDVTEASEEGQIIQSKKEVKHSSKTLHLDRLNDWLEEKKKFYIPNGKLLWLKKKEFFPHLVFCKSIENHAASLSSNQPEFQSILRRLHELESFCSTWESGVFTGEKLPSKVTPESESRLARFKEKLTIICPDGKARLFSWHGRYTPGAGRIYFYPDNSQKIIYIGYIGPKIK